MRGSLVRRVLGDAARVHLLYALPRRRHGRGAWTSSLFLLVGQVTADRVVEAFRVAPKFEIIASNLSNEQEEKLMAAFAS